MQITCHKKCSFEDQEAHTILVLYIVIHLDVEKAKKIKTHNMIPMEKVFIILQSILRVKV